MSEELELAEAELLAAKESGDQEAKDAAAARVVELRAAERVGRSGVIGGDAEKVEE